ncbi:DUF4271 domain-containing protein [Aurantibacter sp.]|uniref:DUF4271 domain-containing protein n=1 Tax=Aurantibacter sp. TaxID=2807103 RepID=UPI0035C8596F
MLRTILNNDSLTLLLLLVIILITVAKLINRKRFFSYFKVLINSSYINTYGKDKKWFDFFNILLFLAFCLVLSIFIVVLNSHLNFTSFLSVYEVLISVGLFFGIKIILELSIGKLLESYQFFRYFLFRKISYRFFLVFFLIPISALLLYHSSLNINIINAFFFVVVLIQFLTYFIVIKTYFDAIKHNLLYFILYLCALEIAPYFILYKHIM